MQMGDQRENLSDDAVIFDKACGGDRNSSLGAEVGVGVSGAHTNSDIDRQENAKVYLSLHNPRAIGKAATAHISITSAGNITLISRNRWRRNEVKLATAVAFIIIKPEKIGAQASLGT